MSITDQIKGILIGADAAAAALLFNGQTDITISARCGMALLDAQGSVYNPDGPHGIELWALDALAGGMNHLQKDHCFQAILGDRDRATKALTVLAPYASFLARSDP